MTDWSIQEIARAAGTTSRTLRHYGEIGLLEPSRIGSNGYRYYDDTALVRLQRILLLRDLGVGLVQIGEMLDRDAEAQPALERHLALLRQEQERLARQIAAVESTVSHLRKGEPLMAETMFDGFDHTRYRAEVEERWGEAAYASSDAWWRGMNADERAAWQAQMQALIDDWRRAADDGADPAGERAQALARRQAEWLRSIPGTPPVSAEYLRGLGEMYVADERFAANYGGITGATFVRDALTAYVAGV